MKTDDYGLAVMFVCLFNVILAVVYLAYKMAIYDNQKTVDDYKAEIRKSEEIIKVAEERIHNALERIHKAFEGGCINDPALEKSLERLDKALEKKHLSDLQFEKAKKKMNSAINADRKIQS
uniref:SHOCT domain-containing protein n=1 Tax=Panagrellus redivivus TaxID=6233 RepID=A0A7E4VSG6_PANRE